VSTTKILKVSNTKRYVTTFLTDRHQTFPRFSIFVKIPYFLFFFSLIETSVGNEEF